MKKLALVLSFIPFLYSAQSQNPLISFEESSTWKFIYGSCSQCISEELQYTFFSGDTVIGNQKYKLIKSYPFGPDGDGKYKVGKPYAFSALRESNDSVFVNDFTQSFYQGAEHLLMYYNVSKGDIYNTDYFKGIVVDSVETQFIAGKNRKVIHLGEMNVIEGVGIYGDWNVSRDGGVDAGYSEGAFAGVTHLPINASGLYLGPLLCFGINGVSTGTFENKFEINKNCVPEYQDFVGGSNVDAVELDIYATNRSLIIKGSEAEEKVVRVYTIQGQEIYKSSSRINTYFDAVFYTAGVFVVKVEVRNVVYSKRVVVK